MKFSQIGRIVSLEPVSNEEGKVQVDGDSINVLKVNGPSSTGTCCWSQMQVVTYAWHNDGFVKMDTAVLDEPLVFQNK